MVTQTSLIEDAWKYWNENKKEGYLELDFQQFSTAFIWFMDNVLMWNYVSHIPVMFPNGTTKILNFDLISKKVKT